MAFEYEFEYQYNVAEQKRFDTLNRTSPLGVGKFALAWCVCFAPSLLCLLWLQMWTIAATVAVFVAIASFVPLLVKFRSKPVRLERTMKLGPVGMLNSVGTARSFQKWNSVDEIIETEHSFLFSRHQRYSVLPKRVIEDSQLDGLRQQIGVWRNHPKDPHLPVEMYRSMLQTETEPGDVIWEITINREELVAVSKSKIRLVDESSFSFRDVESSRRNTRWRGPITIGIMLMLAGFLVITSLPPNRLNWASLAIFVCLNPLVLLFSLAYWIRAKGIRGIPRFHPETYRLRLLDGGWAIGNEDLVNFNAWTPQTAFFLSPKHVGIRSDFGLIHVLPAGDLGSRDGVWQFLTRAIRLKKDWLADEISDPTDSVVATVANNDPELVSDVNPYRPPTVSSPSATTDRKNN